MNIVYVTSYHLKSLKEIKTASCHNVACTDDAYSLCQCALEKASQSKAQNQ